jgi:DNA-binding XRE family transcriptional regulator
MPRSAVDPARAAVTKNLRQEAGRWLKAAREAAGLTQAELAQRVGLRYYTFVSQVESGLGRVPIETQGAVTIPLNSPAPCCATTSRSSRGCCSGKPSRMRPRRVRPVGVKGPGSQ